MKRILSLLVAMIMALSCVGITAMAEDAATVVAKIDTTEYFDFAAAMTAANAMTGDVIVKISGAVEFTDGMELKGGYTSISFVGETDAATITINQTAGGDYLEAHGKTVAFTNLTLAKANPAWSGNSGHMGNYFSVQGGTVTYTNCTFPNGACTNTGTATYDNCTFKNASEYGLWVYDDALVTVNGGTIDSKKGIKVYSEGEDSVTSTLTVRNATFTENVTAKPAVAIGYAESITLIGNTYNNTTGVLELDSGSDADCEGVSFVAQDAEGYDIASTLTAVDRSNSNAACGVLVDGKIYTTVATAAKEATSGSTVTLLHNSTETVTLPEGVTLDKNNYTAENVSVKATTPVEVDTYEELVAALEVDNANIIMTADIIATATQSSGYGKAGIILDAGDVLDGGNHKLTINDANSTWDCAVAMRGGTVKNLTVAGAMRGVFMPGANGDVVIDNCVFEDVIYTFNSDAGSKNYTVTIKNTTLNGWTSYSAVHEHVAFENCKFGEGNGYEFCRPFESTTFTGCEFNEGFELDATKATTETLKFNDCTYNSEKLSAENAVSLLYNGGTVIIDNEKVVLVAKIGSVGYATLQEAFAALKDGDTLQIFTGTFEEGTIKLPATLKNVTIKGAAEHTTVLKDMVIMSADGNSYSYEGITIDGIAFDNSRIVVTGWRTGSVSNKDWTITNCEFKNLIAENSSDTAAPIHFNLDEHEPVNGITITNNVIDGATGADKSGIYLQGTGNVLVENNVINNVKFRPYVIQLTSDDGINDSLVVKGNTFSGSAAGRAQALTNNGEGTDAVELVVNNNIFKDITETWQICYWNFNPEKTTADFSKNYYDVDIEANPGKIYYNSEATSVDELVEIGIYPYYAELDEEGKIDESSIVYPPDYSAAEVNGVEYKKLDAAVSALRENGGTLKLMADVYGSITLNYPEEGAKTELTIDLNGNTLTSAESTLWVSDGYDVTVMDSSEAKTGKIVTTSTGDEAIAVARGGKVTLESGSVVGIGYGVYLYNGNATGKESFIMNGGSVYVPNGGTSIAVGNGIATINGGIITCDKTPITGGGWLAYVYENGTLEITDGEFLGTIGNFGTTAISGGTFSYCDDPNDGFNETHLAHGYIAQKNEDGSITVIEKAVENVAEVNGTKYASLADAVAEANSGDTIILIADAYIAEGTDVIIPDGVTLNGNGYSIFASGTDHDTTTSYGYVVAGGNLTIAGITKIEKLSASYYDHVITIGEGASLEVFGKNRVTLGYGSNINVTGTIADAKTADKAQITPSLKIAAGISITGSNDTDFNVTNAYIVLGNTSSSNKSANAKFGMNFTNSIVEFTNQFTLSGVREGYETLNPVFNVNFKDSVVTATAKLCFAAKGSNVVVDNSNVETNSNVHNSGELTIKNGSAFEGGMIQYGENGGNSGTITVDNASFTINNDNVAYAMDGNDIGKLILKNGATASVDYITETEVKLGVDTKLTCKSNELNATTEPGYEVKYENGVYTAIKAPVAQIGETKYTSLQEALDAAAAGAGNVTVEILDNIDLTNVDWKPVTVSAPGYPVVTVNGNEKTITGLNDMLFAGTWAGGSGLIINDLTIADSTIVNDKDDTVGTVGVGAFIGYPQASSTITLDNCHLVNSTVEGGHWTGGLIGIAGGYSGNDGPVFMNLTIKDCSVKGSTIKGKGSAGGISGHAANDAWTNVVIENTEVSGNTITSTGSSNNKAGAVMGTIGAAGQSATANGETKTGGVSVSATVSGNNVASNGTAITTIYGRQGSTTGALTITGGTYENNPIEENVAYAQPKEGFEILQNENGTYGLVEKEKVELFEFFGMNLDLESSMKANFYISADYFKDTNYYAKIVHSSATGENESIVYFAGWKDNGSYKQISYTDLAAKNMADTVTVSIFDGNDNKVSADYVRSIKDYAEGYIRDYAGTDDKWVTPFVDMLNYGAEAQRYFDYNTENLANAGIGNYQQYATQSDVELKNDVEIFGPVHGANLDLENKIVYNGYFTGVTEDMTAVISYTDHFGNLREHNAKIVKNGIYYQVSVDTLVIADANQPITITVNNSDGNVYAYRTQSINGYLHSMMDDNNFIPLAKAMAKFTKSAHTALHN